MTTDPFTRPLGSLRPEPKRDQWQRYLLPDPRTGKERAWTRATTFAGTVKDTYNINKWEKRLVAKGIATRADLYALAASTPIDDKKKLDRIADDAKEAAKGSSGSNLGTALHAFAEQIDAGLDVIVPQPWDADLAAYRAKLAAERITVHPEWIERIVLVTTYGVAGTFDRILTLPDGRRVIGDLKTGQDLYFDESTIQLALYANATHIIDLQTNKPVPMPAVDQDIAVIIHLPAGQARCELYTIDIKAGWETAYICRIVRDWRTRKDLATRYTGLDPFSTPATDPADMLVDTIGRAADMHELEQLWRDNRPIWQPRHTTAASHRRDHIRAQNSAGTPGGTREEEREEASA